MRLLLDTQVFLWYVWDHPGLSTRVSLAIEEPATDEYVTIASIREMAIK